jgi:hypothetical protein
MHLYPGCALHRLQKASDAAQGLKYLAGLLHVFAGLSHFRLRAYGGRSCVAGGLQLQWLSLVSLLAVGPRLFDRQNLSKRAMSPVLQAWMDSPRA